MLNTQICLTTNVLGDRLLWNSFLLLVGAVLFEEIPSKGRVGRNGMSHINTISIAPAFYRFWMLGIKNFESIITAVLPRKLGISQISVLSGIELRTLIKNSRSN
jgi:hypothetical protein